jgi:hypothetical protein
MDTTLTEAQYVFATLTDYLGAPPSADITWPQAIRDKKDVCNTFEEILGILQVIILKNAAFTKNYRKIVLSDETVKSAHAACCTAMDTFNAVPSLGNFTTLEQALQTQFDTLASLGGGFVVTNDLGAYYQNCRDLLRQCGNLRLSCNSLAAIGLTESLSSINTELEQFKKKLDDIAAKTAKMAEIAAFLGKALTILAKILPLL